MPKYQTKQRKLLISYLSSRPDESISAQEIGAALGAERMSLSAVYRNLAELEAEGQVRRSTPGPNRENYFQYIGCDACRGAIHLSCTRCGKVFHMSPEAAERIAEAVATAENFTLDKGETVLFGLCGRCRA
ncbi:MAG: Fur family transcriptional regulator [bacterium]